jgi:hypothetical protein
MSDETCKYEQRCLGAGKNCFRCFEFSHLKLPEDKKREKNVRKAEKMSGTEGLKPWERLEEQVARDLNKTPTVRDIEARRNPGSGNQWHRPADVLDEILMPETKFRSQVVRGRQVFSLSKEMLEKVKSEAAGTGRHPCLPFQFADDPHIYVIFDWEQLADLVTEYKFYKREWEQRNAT